MTAGPRRAAPKTPELIVEGPEVPLHYARMRRIVEQLNRVLGEPIEQWLVVPPDTLFFELPGDDADRVTIRRLGEDAFEVVFEQQPPGTVEVSRHAPLRETELMALFAHRSSPRRV